MRINGQKHYLLSSLSPEDLEPRFNKRAGNSPLRYVRARCAIDVTLGYGRDLLAPRHRHSNIGLRSRAPNQQPSKGTCIGIELIALVPWRASANSFAELTPMDGISERQIWSFGNFKKTYLKL